MGLIISEGGVLSWLFCYLRFCSGICPSGFRSLLKICVVTFALLIHSISFSVEEFSVFKIH